MPKLFVVSDIHGFYDEMIDALDKAGFDKDNENHWLISCGDTTDRGPKPLEVIRYLESLTNKILISGNHEDLTLECINRGYWGSHDMSNGTFDTICELGGAGEGRSFDECCIVADSIVRPFFNSMVNYFETENYVFVHGFIPVNCNRSLPRNYKPHLKYSAKEDWRYAHQSEWEDAKWLNGMEMAMDGFGIEKTIVCGHFHTSWGHAIQDKTFNEFGEGADFSPFYYEDKLIAIDACTAYSGKVNVLVLEDEFLIKE